MNQAVVPLIFLAAFYWSSNTAFTREAGNALQFDGIDDHVVINTDVVIN